MKPAATDGSRPSWPRHDELIAAGLPKVRVVRQIGVDRPTLYRSLSRDTVRKTDLTETSLGYYLHRKRTKETVFLESR